MRLQDFACFLFCLLADPSFNCYLKLFYCPSGAKKKNDSSIGKKNDEGLEKSKIDNKSESAKNDLQQPENKA